MRGLTYKRRERERHIKRKEHIIRSYQSDSRPKKYNSIEEVPEIIPLNEGNWFPYWYVPHRGMLNKGKIHCSCPMCSIKTKRNGWKHSDLIKIQKEVDNYGENDNCYEI